MFEQTHMHKAFQDYEARQQTAAREDGSRRGLRPAVIPGDHSDEGSEQRLVENEE